MAISCRRSLSSSTRSTFEVSPLIFQCPFSSENRKILARASLRGVGHRTRRTARQRDAKVTARTVADDGDLAAMRLDQLARDGQAETRPLDAAAFRGLGTPAEKQIEDRLALLRRHAGPGIDHFDHRLARRRAR